MFPPGKTTYIWCLPGHAYITTEELNPLTPGWICKIKKSRCLIQNDTSHWKCNGFGSSYSGGGGRWQDLFGDKISLVLVMAWHQTGTANMLTGLVFSLWLSKVLTHESIFPHTQRPFFLAIDRKRFYNASLSDVIGPQWVNTLALGQNGWTLEDNIFKWKKKMYILNQISTISLYWSKQGLSTEQMTTLIARFMGPTLGPPGSCRPQVGPM